MRQQYGRDSDVVVDDVTLLEASFRVKNLLEVRHVDDSPFHIEPRCCGHIMWSYKDDFARTIASLSSRRPLSQRDRSFGHGQNNLNDCNHRSIPQAKAPVFARGVLPRQRLEPSLALTGTIQGCPRHHKERTLEKDSHWTVNDVLYG